MKLTPFRARVLQTVAELLRDNRDGVGLAEVCRAMADLDLPPNRFHAALDALVEQGLLARRPTFPRVIVAITAAGQAVVDAARTAA